MTSIGHTAECSLRIILPTVQNGEINILQNEIDI